MVNSRQPHCTRAPSTSSYLTLLIQGFQSCQSDIRQSDQESSKQRKQQMIGSVFYSQNLFMLVLVVISFSKNSTTCAKIKKKQREPFSLTLTRAQLFTFITAPTQTFDLNHRLRFGPLPGFLFGMARQYPLLGFSESAFACEPGCARQTVEVMGNRHGHGHAIFWKNVIIAACGLAHLRCAHGEQAKQTETARIVG